ANDLRTTEIGLDLFRRVPGAVLSVAGTHRRVAAGAGDAAHRTDSLFHAAAERHSRDRVPQVQLHGFDDALPISPALQVAAVARPRPAHAQQPFEFVGDPGDRRVLPRRANDLRTTEIGLDLFRRVPGAVLSVA
ncbi:hypothetical protein K7G98_36165, partial [Saccharothrix sp. MB29]|nr:hypothetical protein [Saccharothrix sp. MB29]